MIASPIGERLARLLERVELKNPIIPMKLTALPEPGGGNYVHAMPLVELVMQVPDRDTGKLIFTKLVHPVPFGMLRPAYEAEFFKWLRRCVIVDAMHHEVAEMFHVDGVRVADPHNGDSK